jgi:hypothetical protein
LVKIVVSFPSKANIICISKNRKIAKLTNSALEDLPRNYNVCEETLVRNGMRNCLYTTTNSSAAEIAQVAPLRRAVIQELENRHRTWCNQILKQNLYYQRYQNAYAKMLKIPKCTITTTTLF